MGALLTGGVRNPNHQVSTATAAMTRMPPPQSIGFLSRADGEIGSGSGPAGKASTGTGCAGDWGAGDAELGSTALLMTSGARAGAVDAADSVGAAADGTTGSGVALVGWPQDLQNFASVARGA